MSFCGICNRNKVHKNKYSKNNNASRHVFLLLTAKILYFNFKIHKKGTKFEKTIPQKSVVEKDYENLTML
jgi:hypothetical protein